MKRNSVSNECNQLASIGSKSLPVFRAWVGESRDSTAQSAYLCNIKVCPRGDKNLRGDWLQKPEGVG